MPHATARPRTLAGTLLLPLALGLALVPPPAAAQTGTLTRRQVETILKEHRNFYRKDLRGLDLAGLDFRKADLSRADLTGANLQGANLAEANLDHTTLNTARLVGANLQKARLVDASLLRVDLAGADLAGADLTRADLQGSGLRRARLREAILVDAGLIRVDLREADLTGANLQGANLTSALLLGASLARASLRGARVARADFQDADLEGASFVGTDLAAAENFEKARNWETAVLEEPAARPKPAGSEPAAPPWTFRIHVVHGLPIEADSWTDQGTVLVYTRGGVTHGIPRSSVVQVEDARGSPVSLEVATAPKSDEVIRPKTACRSPQIGDPDVVLHEYFRCIEETPRSRTIVRRGRETTLFWIRSRSGAGRDYYYVYNGRLQGMDTSQ